MLLVYNGSTQGRIVYADELQPPTTPEASQTAGQGANQEAGQDANQDASQNTSQDVPAATSSDDSQTQPEDVRALWDGSCIHLRNFEQLSLVGTNAPVTSTDHDAAQVGQGSPLEKEDGELLTYSLDAAYCLDNDIALPASQTWQLPDGFSGSFTGPSDASAPLLWDSAANTIYLYNIYQLAALASEQREDMPVVSGDADPETFGMGEFVLEGDDERILTYCARWLPVRPMV